jgi:hypothetical protein
LGAATGDVNLAPAVPAMSASVSAKASAKPPKIRGRTPIQEILWASFIVFSKF